MISIICSECKKTFTWIRPPGRHGTRQPQICGKREMDGKWEANPACYNARQAKLFQIRKEKYPEKYKANQEKQCKKRKYNQQLQTYISKNVPKPKAKRYCQYPGCKCLTAFGGINRYYCQRHWGIMTNDIAGDEYICISNDTNPIDVADTQAADL